MKIIFLTGCGLSSLHGALYCWEVQKCSRIGFFLSSPLTKTSNIAMEPTWTKNLSNLYLAMSPRKQNTDILVWKRPAWTTCGYARSTWKSMKKPCRNNKLRQKKLWGKFKLHCWCSLFFKSCPCQPDPRYAWIFSYKGAGWCRDFAEYFYQE